MLIKLFVKVYLNIIMKNNKRKEFKITTDVKEIDNIKGGSISGEDEKSYETVF